MLNDVIKLLTCMIAAVHNEFGTLVAQMTEIDINKTLLWWKPGGLSLLIFWRHVRRAPRKNFIASGQNSNMLDLHMIVIVPCAV